MAYQRPGFKSILRNNADTTRPVYLGPPTPGGGSGQTDPPQPGGKPIDTIAPSPFTNPPAPPPNPLGTAAQRRDAFRAANPDRRPDRIGLRPDGTPNYDPSIYGTNYRGPQGAAPRVPGNAGRPPAPPVPSGLAPNRTTPPAKPLVAGGNLTSGNGVNPTQGMSPGGTLASAATAPQNAPPAPSANHVWVPGLGWVLPPPSPGNGEGGGGA